MSITKKLLILTMLCIAVQPAQAMLARRVASPAITTTPSQLAQLLQRRVPSALSANRVSKIVLNNNADMGAVVLSGGITASLIATIVQSIQTARE